MRSSTRRPCRPPALPHAGALPLPTRAQPPRECPRSQRARDGSARGTRPQTLARPPRPCCRGKHDCRAREGSHAYPVYALAVRHRTQGPRSGSAPAPSPSPPHRPTSRAGSRLHGRGGSPFQGPLLPTYAATFIAALAARPTRAGPRPGRPVQTARAEIALCKSALDPGWRVEALDPGALTVLSAPWNLGSISDPLRSEASFAQ